MINKSKLIGGPKFKYKMYISESVGFENEKKIFIIYILNP